MTRSESKPAMLDELGAVPVGRGCAWLPALAHTLGAKMRVPRFVGRLAAGEVGLVMITDVRGASNAKAMRELAWQPQHPSWREGFAAP